MHVFFLQYNFIKRIFLQFTKLCLQWKNGKWGTYEAYEGLAFLPVFSQSNSYYAYNEIYNDICNAYI